MKMSKRTTLTLDDDVATRLEEEMHRRRLSFKKTVNEVLRAGLAGSSAPATSPPFRIRARALSVRPGIDLDDVGALLERLEGPDHR